MKWWSYIICFGLALAGAFCGWRYYEDVKATSYETGSIKIENVFFQDSFVYKSSSIYFYEMNSEETEVPDETETTETESTYFYKVDLLPVTDFNAETKTYEVTVNGNKVFNPVFTPGSVTFEYGVEFYDTNGDVLVESLMTCRINFFVEKTVMQLEVQGETARDYMQNYVALNGLSITVSEVVV